MSAVLKTEVQIAMDGTARVVQNFNEAAKASQSFTRDADAATEKFTGLAKVIGHLGGAGRYEFMAIYAAGEAVASAGKNFGEFTKIMGNTAVFAGMAFAMGMVVKEAKAISAETDAMWDALAKGTDDEVWREELEKQKGFFHNLKMGLREIFTGDVSSGVIGNLVASLYGQFTDIQPDRIRGIDFTGLPSEAEIAKAYENVTKSTLDKHRLAKAVIDRFSKEQSLIEKQAFALDLEANVRGITVNKLPDPEIKRILDAVKAQMEDDTLEINLKAQVRMEEATGRPTRESIFTRDFLDQRKAMEATGSGMRGASGLTGAEIDTQSLELTRQLESIKGQRSEAVTERGRLMQMAEWARAGGMVKYTQDPIAANLPQGIRTPEAEAIRSIRETTDKSDPQWNTRVRERASSFFEGMAQDVSEDAIKTYDAQMAAIKAQKAAMENERQALGHAVELVKESDPMSRRLNAGATDAESASLFIKSQNRGMDDILRRQGVAEDKTIVEGFDRMLADRQKQGLSIDPFKDDFKEWAADVLGTLKAVYATPDSPGFFQKRRSLNEQVADYDANNPPPWMRPGFGNLTDPARDAAITQYGTDRRRFIGDTQDRITGQELAMEFSKNLEKGRLTGEPNWAAEMVDLLRKQDPEHWFTRLGVKTEREGFIRAEGLGEQVGDVVDRWQSALSKGPQFAGAAEEGSVEAYRAILDNRGQSTADDRAKEVQRQQLESLRQMVELIRSKGISIYQLQ